MTKAITNLNDLLRTMAPTLNDGVYAYTVLPPGAGAGGLPALATFREAEGLTLIMREADAIAAGLPLLFRAAWITLSVHSDLQAAGLTAAFSRALADAGIGCNVVAAAHHDHLFVAFDRADEAMACLKALQDAGGVAGS